MNIIVFSSQLHDTNSVMAGRRKALEEFFDGHQLHLYSCEDFPPQGETACFIATGGTEELFAGIWQKLPRPVMLLSDGYHNSFAAAKEIASFLEQHGVEHRLVNLPLTDEDGAAQGTANARANDATADGTAAADSATATDSADDTATAASAAAAELCPDPYAEPRVRQVLANARIGLIGGASSWLIASGIDRGYVSQTYDAQFIDIPIAELEAAFRAEPAAEAAELSPTYSRKALQEAERMYRALKSLCNKYALTALTIKCFDLLDSCRTTSCLALARLSDEGIISGCEGDIPALWTLLVAKALTGRAAFMANPSSSSAEAATVDFAHCTVPLSMCSSYSLPSHFESGIGIGIAGIIPEGPCNIIKIGGPRLDRIYCSRGTIVCNTHVAARCRTQIRFRFDSRAEFDRFMACRLGNHIVLCR